jgi:hypothetical protein
VTPPDLRSLTGLDTPEPPWRRGVRNFSFSLEASIGVEGGLAPTVTLAGAPGATVTVTWPTSDGPQTQVMAPGDPLTLANVVGD